MRNRRPATATNPVTEYDNLEHFLMEHSVPTGRFVVPYEGVPVDFLYNPKPGAQTTVVFFHGATKPDVSLPMFAGGPLMEGVPASRLAISDPTLALDDSYKHILSWFAGSSFQPKLQRFNYLVIREVLERTRAHHRIFMGGSGGGFAALEMSRHFPDSVVIAMNPQTSLRQYNPPAVRRYLDLSWSGIASLEDLPRTVISDLPVAYPSRLNHTVAYIQNTRDTRHVKNHQRPFLKKVGEDNSFFMLMDAWGDPEGNEHVLPPREEVKRILRTIVLSEGRWNQALGELGFTPNTTAIDADNAVRQVAVRAPSAPA